MDIWLNQKNAHKVKIMGNVTNWPTYGWTTSKTKTQKSRKTKKT
jgi:hypothetical protein